MGTAFQRSFTVRSRYGVAAIMVLGLSAVVLCVPVNRHLWASGLPGPGVFEAEIAFADRASGERRPRLIQVQASDTANEDIARFIKLFAQKARLDAERNGAQRVIFPAGFEASSSMAKSVAELEARLFAAKRAADQNQKAQLQQRIGQFTEEMRAIEAQQKAKRRELDLVRRELRLVEGLHKKQLTNEVRLIGMQREIIRFEGEDAAFSANIARIKTFINEVNLQIAAVDNATRIDAEKELRIIETELNELVERRNAGGFTESGGALLAVPGFRPTAMSPVDRGEVRAAAPAWAAVQGGSYLPPAASAEYRGRAVRKRIHARRRYTRRRHSTPFHRAARTMRRILPF